MNTEPVQTSEPAVKREKYKRDGLTIVRRGRNFICRITFRGKVHALTLTETVKESFDIALRARREIIAGRWIELKAATSLRATPKTLLGEVFRVYRLFIGLDRPLTQTIEQNINAITSMVRDVLGESVEPAQMPLVRLNDEFVWKWKELKRATASVADSDERAQQILRSANSRLRQARSLFSDNEDLRTFYRMHKLALPPCISGFCEESPFSDCSKDEYHAPNDRIIVATFHALDAMPASGVFDLNLYKACWLAVGFGLRRSEISKARNGWFINIDGVIFCRGDELAKNKKYPEVRAQLGAWDKLKPYIEDKELEDYVLSGTETERTDDTFRRVSEFMRKMGWQTTHHLHELRAWAGCQIAMAPGNDIRDAQVFLRHAQFGTTEKFYGHHLKIKMKEVKMSLPSIAPPKPFVVLPAAEQAS